MLHWENIARGALGMTFLVLVCYLLSNNRRAINWKLVGLGICAQIMFAMGVLDTQAGGQPVFWLLFGIAITVFTVRRIMRKAKEGFGLTGDPLPGRWRWPRWPDFSLGSSAASIIRFRR